MQQSTGSAFLFSPPGNHRMWLRLFRREKVKAAWQTITSHCSSFPSLPSTESVPVYHHRAGHGHGGQPELRPVQHGHRHHHGHRHQRQPPHVDLQNCEWLQMRGGRGKGGFCTVALSNEHLPETTMAVYIGICVGYI